MGKLDVRIRHGGGPSVDPTVILVIVAIVLVATGGGSVAAATSGLASGLATLVEWLTGVFGGGIVVCCVLAIVFRRRVRALMVRRGDPKNELDDLARQKRAELAKIRAMRLQLEAARIAGVEITPDILRMAEDPELADLVMRFRATVGGRQVYLPVESGPRGGE